jgi:hypothetical protein
MLLILLQASGVQASDGLMSPDIIKSLSGSVTQIVIFLTAIVGVIATVIKEIFAKRKEQKATSAILSSLKEDISKFTTDLKREINENETATQKRISELELTSTRYFGELLRAHNRGESDQIKEIMARLVHDIYNRDFENGKRSGKP